MRVQLLNENAHLPTKAHETDIGWDLYASEDITIFAGDISIVPTGIRVDLIDRVCYDDCCDSPDVFALMHDRSSMAAKGLHVLAGVIDPGYHGEIKVVLANLSKRNYFVNKGDRVAQLIIYQTADEYYDCIEQVDDINAAIERATSGFGSSGR